MTQLDGEGFMEALNMKQQKSGDGSTKRITNS